MQLHRKNKHTDSKVRAWVGRQSADTWLGKLSWYAATTYYTLHKWCCPHNNLLDSLLWQLHHRFHVCLRVCLPVGSGESSSSMTHPVCRLIEHELNLVVFLVGVRGVTWDQKIVRHQGKCTLGLRTRLETDQKKKHNSRLQPSMQVQCQNSLFRSPRFRPSCALQLHLNAWQRCARNTLIKMLQDCLRSQGSHR